MPAVETNCPVCGASCETHTYQRITRERLAWSAAFNCRENHQTEIDGFGLPPRDLRSGVLNGEGAYELNVDESAELGSSLLRLQKSLGFSASALRSLRRMVPGPILYGTRFEMEWLAGILGSEHASVSPRESSRASPSLDLAEIMPSS